MAQNVYETIAEVETKQEILTVSIVIPVYNEALYIEECLTSIFKQDYNFDYVEIVLIDGGSTDNTVEIIETFATSHSNIRLLHNPHKTVQYALNIGILSATGDIIVRMDAHTEYGNDYVTQCIKALLETDAFDVGGPTVASGKTVLQKVIAATYQSPFALGGGRHYQQAYEGYADTVSFGAYRRSDIIALGMYDERFPRSEDDELSLRILKSGKKIYITPKIKSIYYPRDNYKKLFKQYYEYGLWKPAVIRKHKKPAKLSHLVPAAFVAFLILGGIASVFSFACFTVYAAVLLLYVGIDICFSFTSKNVTRVSDKLRMMAIHFILHISYGLGFLVGVKRFYLQNQLGV